MVSNKNYIAQHTQVDKELALRLEHALKGVADQMLEQGELMADAFQRLTWYTSCFTNNYQDVCSKLSNEDTRFLKGLVELVNRRDIIADMIRVYVETSLQSESDNKIQRVVKQMTKLGATFASNGATSRTLAISIATTVSHSFTIKSSLGKKNLSRYSNVAATFLTGYGYVKKAADAADELKRVYPIYYNILYRENLEMMYFIVQPVIQRNYALLSTIKSEQQITDALMRLMY